MRKKSHNESFNMTTIVSILSNNTRKTRNEILLSNYLSQYFSNYIKKIPVR
jgi:hypothetical protein